MGRLGILGSAGALITRPSLIWEAALAAGDMRKRGLPGPSKAYLNWRLETAYGSGNARSGGEDLVHYLAWRRQMRRLRKWEVSR